MIDEPNSNQSFLVDALGEWVLDKIQRAAPHRAAPNLTAFSRQELRLRVRMGRLAMAVAMLTMLMGSRGMSLGFLVVAVAVVMGGFPVVVGGCLVMGRGIVMVLDGYMLLRADHGVPPLSRK
jgi:hypothetical protein